MKVIVGLGNPGKKYDGTRHNVGFEVLRHLAERWFAEPERERFESFTQECVVAQEKVLLVRPLTFMNLSGRAVRQIVEFHKLPVEHLLIVCDDIALPLGKIRLRAKGSAGGQRGLENVIQNLKTQEIARLRLGVDAPPSGMDAADYVLSRFGKAEQQVIEASLIPAADACEYWMKDGIASAMNRFNGGDPAVG